MFNKLHSCIEVGQSAAEVTYISMPHLVRLCNICEDDIHHGHQHAVLGRMPGVLNDGDDIGPLLGHVDQVTPCRQGSRCNEPCTACLLLHNRGASDQSQAC